VAIKRLIPALVVCLMVGAVGSFAGPYDNLAVDTLVDRGGGLWQTSPDTFLGEYGPYGFVWESAAQDTARMAKPGMTFAGLPVVEAIARFENQRLVDLSLSLYNRGDEKELREEQFDDLVASADAKLSAWAGSRGVEFKEEDRTDFITVRRKAWVADANRLDLTWSFTAKHYDLRIGLIPLRCEYVRLQITPFNPAQDPRRMFEAPMISKTRMLTVLDLQKRVVRSPSGDVLIDSVPMIDQGRKGYCAAAVAARLLQYFGSDVDQHDIAQAADTSAVDGTNPEVMMAALRQIGSQFNVQVDVLQDFTAQDYERLKLDYNRLARPAHHQALAPDTTGTNTMLGVIHEMNLDVYKQARARRESARDDFHEDVTKYINAGVPLAWNVVLGIVDETPPVHGFGGHVRLIIGYNDQTGEILYTDSWGAGHELKRMTLADAWAITFGLYVIEPENIHL
jgi:hypothetical protein